MSLFTDYPIHLAVWKRDNDKLQRLLNDQTLNLNERDHLGNTPLHLAIHFKNKPAVDLILSCPRLDITYKNAAGWSPLQEAISTTDVDIIWKIIQKVQPKIQKELKERIPNLNNSLLGLPDFYLELRWEFKTWVPLISRWCPYDNYKIWKKGSKLRIDTTLIGFENMNWIRGNISFIYTGDHKEHPGELMMVNHDKKSAVLGLLGSSEQEKGMSAQTEEELKGLLRGDITRSELKTDKVVFTPQKSWWGNNKTEQVGSYQSITYDVNGFEFVTKTRKTTLTTTVTGEEDIPFRLPEDSTLDFDHYWKNDKKYKNILSDGLLYPSESVSIKKRPITGTVWFAKEFPRTVEDLMPLFEVLAPKNKHFRRLKEFLTLRFPQDSGFPIKIEIPIIPALSGVVTFLDYQEIQVESHIVEPPTDYTITRSSPDLRS